MQRIRDGKLSANSAHVCEKSAVSAKGTILTINCTPCNLVI
jgi:hypothetical protein